MIDHTVTAPLVVISLNAFVPATAIFVHVLAHGLDVSVVHGKTAAEAGTGVERWVVCVIATERGGRCSQREYCDNKGNLGSVEYHRC